ncbi:MAG: heme-binding protein [Alphaproteobacteria bacterium]|nr:heme-binding protein [Alphaproteobacteria bacterium]
MKLDTARTIVDAAQKKAREMGLKPLAITVLDARGAVRAFIAEDGTSLHRGDVAIGKAYGAISLGIPSRAIGERAEKQAYFVAAISHITGGKMVPVAGGVLIRDASGELLGAIGISGDTSDNDETAACTGIVAAGLVAETG